MQFLFLGIDNAVSNEAGNVYITELELEAVIKCALLRIQQKFHHYSSVVNCCMCGLWINYITNPV